MSNFKSYKKTILMEALALIDGDMLYIASGYAVHFVRMFLLLGVWRSVFSFNGELGTEQAGTVLQYTVLASAFYQQLDVKTTASVTLWEGTVASRYLRPMSVFGQYISETVGRWLPGLFFFTLPVLIASPLTGVSLIPEKFINILWSVISLVLGISLGFAMDFIFTAIMVRFGNMHYHAYRLRSAVTVLLSGVIIPLYLLPWGLGDILKWLPFASMASAPLQIYTGTGNAVSLILLQGSWCVILWIGAVSIWKRNRQRLVIFGG